MKSARALLAGVIDYAGLFPPAGLPMREAVGEYVAACSSRDGWMLGRFVLPAGKLPELDCTLTPEAEASMPWRLSAIVRDGSEADHASIEAFGSRHQGSHLAVDSVECRPETLAGIDWLASVFAPRDVYVEVVPDAGAEPWLARIAARGLKAKIRTGGLTAEAFPEPGALLAFIEAAVRLGVPFKATAGLHHPLRGSYRLTYERGAPCAPMHGYLNLLLATAAIRAGRARSEAARLLIEADAADLHFGTDGIRWGAVELPASAVGELRTGSFTSFGSCSFREPVDELHALTTI